MKIGFIGGSGHHYLRHLLGSAHHADITVAVASDGHDAAASAKFAESLRQHRPTLQWFDDGLALLDQFQPDVLSVGSVYGFNGDWNIQSLQRDIPTVTDKPAAATWAQFDRLKALTANNPNRVLLTEFDFHSRPAFRAARAAVAAGQIGDVAMVTAQKSYRYGTRAPWYADRTAYSGTLMWIASHGLDAVGFVSGRNFTKLIGHQGNISKPAMGTMEDHLAVLGELEGGGTAVVHADLCRPTAATTHGDDRLRVVGSVGQLEIISEHCTLITHDQPARNITSEAAVQPIQDELLAAIHGHSTMWYSTANTMSMARLLLLAREATDQQRWIDVPSP